MDILGFIPARASSKEIPDKNIYPLCGKPLIYYTIRAASESKINRCVVSTDSEKIASLSRSLGAEVPFLRPKDLSTDTALIEEALSYTLERLYEEEEYCPKLIVLLHPTTPLRASVDIDNSIDLLRLEKVDSVVSVSEPREHPADMLRWERKNYRIDFLLDNIVPGLRQRQSYPKYYFLNGCVYVFTYVSFQKNKNRFGKRSSLYEMPQNRSIDIDSMDDMTLAAALLSSTGPV